MSQSGFTPIQLYYSTTASTAPSAGNLANGELAINITDGKLFYKDNGGVVQVLATKGAGTIGGSNTQVQYNSSGALAGSANLTFDGTTLTLGANPVLSGGTANGVAYLNGSKVVTTGSALTFDGTSLGVNGGITSGYRLSVNGDLWQGNGSGVGVGTIANASGWYEFSGSGNVNGIQFSHPSIARWLIGGSEQMRLTSTGLGIGTSSPQYKLDVTSNIAINGVGGNGYGLIGYAGATPSTGFRFSLTRQDAIAAGSTYLNSYGAIGFGINKGSTGTPADAPNMLLDSSGNLGLGVTPSAWTGRALQVGGTSALYQPANKYTNIASNFYEDTGGAARYLVNGFATLYSANRDAGIHAWYTAPSGTAGNAISFTQAMTLDASGNLGIGNTSASGMRMWVTGYSPELYDPTTFSAKFAYLPKGSQEQFEVNLGATLKAGYANLLNIGVGDNNGQDQVYFGAVGQSVGNAGAHFVFGRRTGAQTWAESARIDSSGNLLVGTTSSTSPNPGFSVYTAGAGNTQAIIGHSTSSGSGQAYSVFLYNGGTIGSITQSGTTAVLYNVTSDYRLKNVLGAVTDAGARIDALEPIEYEWKANGIRTRGFLAHKFQEVYPQSVTGEKDAVDAEGNPVYQQMQGSTNEVIADFVAELKSLRARVAQLEGK